MMKNKKLLYVASTMGHIENFHTEIIDAMRRRGYDVMTLARGDRADFDIPFEKKLLSVKNLACLVKIRKILMDEEFGGVILNTTLASVCVRLALPKRLKKTTKVVNFVHGYLFSDIGNKIKNAFFLMCERLVRKKCDVIITMNSYDYLKAKQHKLATERIECSRGVGVSVRDEVTAPEKIRRELFGTAAPVITFVAELSKRKNQAFLIRCLKCIREAVPGTRLCLVGDGSEYSMLLKLTKRLSLGGCVIFAGYRPDATDIIRASDMYVSSSLSEGLPLNVLEAMYLGKTVLATRIKGHTDIINDGENGYLFSVGDASGFVSSAVRILSGGKIDERTIKESVLAFDRARATREIAKILDEVFE